MKYLLITMLLMFPTLATAQEEGADPITECGAVLASPPFVDILTRNEGKDFHELSSRNSGQQLLGLECGVDELTDFFEIAGWEFLRFEEFELAGPLGGRSGIPEHYIDASAFYCRKRPTILQFFPRCAESVEIFFHEGKISYLIPYVSK